MSRPTLTRALTRALPRALPLLLLVAAACSGPEGSGDEPGLLSPPDPLSRERAAEAEARGGPAAAALAQGLMTRLGEAIEAGGTEGAVDFCAEEALVLTRVIGEEVDPSLEIRRTTTRWRNPANAPDEAEARVLRYLEALEAQTPGSAPEILTAAGPDGSARFYRTLRTAPMCLQCHGAESELAPEVRQAIGERYPDDRATGYEAGAFRGVIRVQIPAGATMP